MTQFSASFGAAQKISLRHNASQAPHVIDYWQPAYTVFQHQTSSLSYRRLGLNGDHTGRHDLNRFHRMLRLTGSLRSSGSGSLRTMAARSASATGLDVGLSTNIELRYINSKHGYSLILNQLVATGAGSPPHSKWSGGAS